MKFLKKIMGGFAMLAFLLSSTVMAHAWTNTDTVKVSLNGDRKVVYLTFDDGPDTKNTLKVMNTLLNYNVGGTFFFTGQNMPSNPKLVKQIYDNGFTVGSHGYNHSSFKYMSFETLAGQINKTNEILASITGEKCGIVRPPYGDFNNTTIANLANLNQRVYLWSSDTNDWAKSSSGPILEYVKNTLKPGDIILMHSGAGQPLAAEVLPQIIEFAKSKGYSIESLPDPSIRSLVVKPASTKLDVNKKSMLVNAYVINNKVYLKLKDVAALVDGTSKSFYVAWDAPTKASVLSTNRPFVSAGDELTTPSNQKRAMPVDATVVFNGSPMSIPAYRISDSNYFSLRDVSTWLGITIDFDQETSTIKLNTAA